MHCDLTEKGEEDLRRVTESIVQKAQGVFLWVRLVVNEVVEGLCEGDTTEELEEVILTLPAELGDLYTRALRRPLRSSSHALLKDKYETYVMFQIVSTGLGPFPLHVFFAIVQFLTAKKESKPKLPALSRDQLERRLYSRSAGLLETLRDSERLVQFIHQTTKEFLTDPDGLKVIRKGLNLDELKSGVSLICQFISKLFDYLSTNTLEEELERFLVENCGAVAQALEWREQRCFADYLTPDYFEAPAHMRRNFLCQALRYIRLPSRLTSNFDVWKLSDLVPVNDFVETNFYICCNLPLSLKKSLSNHKSPMTWKDCYYHLNLLLQLKSHHQQERGSRCCRF